jgi:hypothetical protein
MMGSNTTGSGDSNDVQMTCAQKTEPDFDEP